MKRLTSKTGLFDGANDLPIHNGDVLKSPHGWFFQVSIEETNGKIEAFRRSFCSKKIVAYGEKTPYFEHYRDELWLYAEETSNTKKLNGWCGCDCPHCN